jgi:hypothetical protein
VQFYANDRNICEGTRKEIVYSALLKVADFLKDFAFFFRFEATGKNV